MAVVMLGACAAYPKLPRRGFLAFMKPEMLLPFLSGEPGVIRFGTACGNKPAILASLRPALEIVHCLYLIARTPIHPQSSHTCPYALLHMAS